MDYEIGGDGVLRVGRKDDIKGGFERAAREAEGVRAALDEVEHRLNDGWDGIHHLEDPALEIDAALARRIVLPQGETTLRKEVDRLLEVEALRVMIDGVASTEPYLQAVEERSLQSHLEELARRSGLLLLPWTANAYLLTTPDRVETDGAWPRKMQAAYESALGVLAKPLAEGGPYTVPEFAEALQASLGLTVVPSEPAWNDSSTFTVPPGLTLRQNLDLLKAQGFRWGLNDGKLYLLK
jgi:hypothetical protein